MSFPKVNAREILRNCNSIAAATASACSSASSQTSHVLQAMGKSDESMLGAIRFSLGRFSTKEEICFVIEALKNMLA